MDLNRQILSDVLVYSKYARYVPELNRREVWNGIVDRNKYMHCKKFPKLVREIDAAYEPVYDRLVLPSMRSLQFAGKPIEISQSRMFNCAYLAVDDYRAFSETMFLLLGGSGVGYSVQTHHVEQLPPIQKPKKDRRYLIGDSIEGWADAVKALMKSYFGMSRTRPRFDFSDIRPKGSRLVTAGGKAPGAEPLKECLFHIQKILDRKDDGDQLSSLECHDIQCYISDAVLAGGIRRSAMISLFDIDDEAMLTCKYGSWWEKNPQRARANNSAMTLRHKVTEADFKNLWAKMQASGSGDPAIFWSNDKEMGTNPCGEIGLKNMGFCNLTTQLVSDVKSQTELERRSRAAAFIGTLQASYTDFHYLRDGWRLNAEREALLGVSMTGIATESFLDLDLQAAAKVVLEENERVAGLIGINKAARTTCVKPEGTTSLVLGTSSGAHAWHAPYYIRRVLIGKNEPLYPYLAENHPELLEDEFLKPHLQANIRVPIQAPEGAITREESPLDLLERVKHLNTDWIRPGHRRGANTHNVSCTVSLRDDEWDAAGQWMWENRNYYNCISVLPFYYGSHKQPPFQDCDKETYEQMSQYLRKVDLSQVKEEDDETNLAGELACAGGACTVTSL